MKATLEFNMPEERQEFDIAVKAMAMASFMSEFYRILRDRCKYDENPPKEYEEIKSQFIGIAKDFGLEDIY